MAARHEPAGAVNSGIELGVSVPDDGRRGVEASSSSTIACRIDGRRRRSLGRLAPKDAWPRVAPGRPHRRPAVEFSYKKRRMSWRAAGFLALVLGAVATFGCIASAPAVAKAPAQPYADTLIICRPPYVAPA